MKKITALIALGILLLAGVALAMGDLYVSGTWRYKMTVVVETPEGIKTGSSVREVSNSASSVRLDLPEGTNPADIKGEAVVVDLGERGLLFALMSDQSASEFYNAFPVRGPTTADGIRYYNSLKPGQKAVLDISKYPMLVTFTDLDDPKSVTLVHGWRFDPKIQKSRPVDDFEKIFGKEVHLKSVTIEITDEPVTREIAQRIPWLSEIGGKYLGQSRNARIQTLNLHGGHFRRGGDNG